MIKRITTRGTATVGELIEALQELKSDTEVYVYAAKEDGEAIESFVDAIEFEKDFVFIGTEDSL